MPVLSGLNNPLILVFFGIIVGIFSGVMGLGGGAVMVPLMVLAYQMSQTKAHGTSLAVLALPVTLGAVITYYKNGNVDVRMAIYMAIGFALGAIGGALFANSIKPYTLKLIFGFLLIYVAAYTVYGKENMLRTVGFSALLVVIAVVLFFGARWYDQRSAAQAAAAPSAEVRTQ